LYPGYVKILRRFARALSQKNALLKRAQNTWNAAEQLDAFDVALAAAGEEISRRRGEYLATAGPAALRYYEKLTQKTERLSISFCPSAKAGELAEKLIHARPTDLRAGFSTVGPHREDFEVLINETSARTYGSQGQQRSAILALKLAEAETARTITGQTPVLLLDDVLSELDETRQAYLLSHMNSGQSFVTCCVARVFNKTAGLVVCIKTGQIAEG
jgi:DNA replication and repair protein RecF